MALNFACMVCGKGYEELEEAEVCEEKHGVLPRLEVCGFCDHAPCRCYAYAAPVPKVLPAEALLRLGAMTLEQEKSQAVEELLDEQERTYKDASREELIAALRDRDRLLAHQGRALADGRTASRLLREFMRAALYQADGKRPPELVESALKSIGAEAADARQVKLHGSTLGPLEAPERVAGELAEGRRKAR